MGIRLAFFFFCNCHAIEIHAELLLNLCSFESCKVLNYFAHLNQVSILFFRTVGGYVISAGQLQHHSERIKAIAEHA